MTRLRYFAIFACVLFNLGVTAAEAVYIVDTGQGTSGTQLSLHNLGSSFQHLGATFNVSQASSITSVEGWISVLATGDVVFELHQGVTPNGALLFSSGLVRLNAGTDAWHGATGLDWDVLAGDYTLAVIAQSGFSGGMPLSPPTPLGTEWFNGPLSGGWTQLVSSHVGWRVDAVEATVPEPAILVLLGSGLCGLCWVRRRSKRT